VGRRLERAATPDWLVDLVERLMHSDPTCRPASAAEVGHRLREGEGPEAQIISPRPGELLPRAFSVEIKLAGMPPDTHVWAAVQRGRLSWPKEPGAPPGVRVWRLIAHEGGPARAPFSLVLWLVSAEGDERIRAWLERGQCTGDYPGLVGMPGALRELGRVDGLEVE
jgi:hypothetical protein